MRRCVNGKLTIFCITFTAVLATFAAQAMAASITLRYWTGSNAAQISGLGSIRDCERLAKQKQLTSNHYYCIQTGKSFDRNFEKRNNWN